MPRPPAAPPVEVLTQNPILAAVNSPDAQPPSPRIEYDPALPITAHRREILEALERHRVIVVSGATGSGKTTQLPKMCLEAGRGTHGKIGHTQPRRIAARAIAGRLAAELNTNVGELVGFQVRFNDRIGPNTRIKLMTDGILLKELENDRNLRRYDTLIIDEAHERSLNIDLLLGALKQLTARRADLRVIITSATIDPEKFARFFEGAPIIEVSGRSYPIEVRYRPLIAEDEDAAELSLPEGIVAAVRELDRGELHAGEDVLVFLPGEKHIREAAEALNKAHLPRTEILPLFARLSAREQERIFSRGSQRRVVLATNVAETSLTVPGIRHVVDSGLARISRYNVRGKVQRLPIERVSQASANQRKGRCGREAEGICIRLYSEEDFQQREAFTQPEILRTNLASVILRMSANGLGEPETFPFLDPPDTRLVNDGVRLLQELKAMDEDRRVTSLGHQLATLPLDPRLGRMLMAAARQRCLTEMLVIASFLEIQDPRERPADAQMQADQKHALFADPRSDFIAALNLWKAYSDHAQAVSGSQLRKWCREHFLSFVRMREWQDLQSQIADAASDLGLKPNTVPAQYAELHQAILTGFLGSIGELDERREYQGARGSRFVIAPGTPVAAHRPKWVVAGSLLETTRLYARMVASVAPGWIESAGAHLLKRTYGEVHWFEARGYVAAFESVSLFGLTLASRRRVNYGSIGPKESHEMFVREALVEGRARLREGFVEANRKLREEVERMEAKIRRRDILVDELAQMDFYLARIPDRINTVSAFERWREEAERADPKLLYMTSADLMRRDAPEAGPDQFPDALPLGNNVLPLTYRLDPTAPDDGITVIAPEPLVDTLHADQLAWLVPGLQLEKVTAVLRALPKAIRKQFVPVPDYAKTALAERRVDDPKGFYEWLAGWISHRAGTPVSAADLAALPLPDHLRVNIRAIDQRDRVLAESRDLSAVRHKVHVAQAASATGRTQWGGDSGLYRQWDFGDLPESVTVERNRLRLIVYPALEDRGQGGVALVETTTAAEAEELSRAGMVRLAMLALPQQTKLLRKQLAEDRELVLRAHGIPLTKPFADALTERAFAECFFPASSPLPRTKQAFEAAVETRRADLFEIARRVTADMLAFLRNWRAVKTLLDDVRKPVFADGVADIEAQLAGLVPTDFITSMPYSRFEQLPRYLKAIERRLERLTGDVKRDAELAGKVKPFLATLRMLSKTLPTALSARQELEQFRWMIEEFRVSLFAQELRTAVRVSEKRLAEQADRARISLQG